MLQERIQPLAGRCQPLPHVVVHKLVIHLDGLHQRDLGLLIGGLKLRPPRRVLYVISNSVPTLWPHCSYDPTNSRPQSPPIWHSLIMRRVL